LLAGFVSGGDSVNDYEMTITDGNGGEEVVPTATYDATALGLNGALLGGHLVDCPNGIYVTITCGGAMEVTIYYKEVKDIGHDVLKFWV